MKIRDGFILRRVMGKPMVIPVGERSREFSGMIKLNEAAADLWAWLAEDTTKEALVARLQETYDVDEATALRDVDAFLATLQQEGLLEHE